MNNNYIMYKCVECGTVFIVPTEFVNHSNNYVTCPMHGQHHQIKVIGAYDDLCECMDHSSYRVEGGVIKQKR